jgi:hypothetical protein
VDKRIEQLALDLAECRADLAPGRRLILASVLAHRVRVFRREDPRDR